MLVRYPFMTAQIDSEFTCKHSDYGERVSRSSTTQDSRPFNLLLSEEPMTVPRNHVKPGRVASLYRNAVLRQLSKLKHGVLTIQDPWGGVRIGEGRAGLFPEIRVHDPRFYKRVLFRGDLGAAESLMDGDWSSESLTETVRFFIRNMNLVDKLDRGVAHWSHLASRCVHWLKKYASGARRNISQHYDLGNDFYCLFLDDTMAYLWGFSATRSNALRRIHREVRSNLPKNGTLGG